MKEYITPVIEEEVVELEDVIAESFGQDLPGDTEGPFWS